MTGIPTKPTSLKSPGRKGDVRIEMSAVDITATFIRRALGNGANPALLNTKREARTPACI
jgi:hypothetical protein